MPHALSLPQLCGQLLVVGFSGTSLPPTLETALRQGRMGGIIVFKRNLPSLEIAHAINRATQGAAPAELPPFIAVDQEGGRVGRLPPPFVKLPPMRQLGALGDLGLLERVGRLLGTELRRLGYNLDFAPVLDVDSNPDNPVIGDRAFSADPAEVSRLASATLEGIQAAGVMACGKHFPGHGDTHLDSHLDLPFVRHPEARLRAVELPPFRAAVQRGVATLMTAHVVYDGLDPDRPATLSPRISTELLRGELGFAGVLFSDDLEMRALADRMSVEESSVAAIRAGCDALLVCSDLALADRAHAALTREAERDPSFHARCLEAATRGLEARQRFPPRPDADASGVGGREARELEAEIAARLG
ncbi:MAG: beta-N-acetylhexosaminidase [Myxococcales bacterium]|nr:beta-N-acetylhexosaminidase [Myxococcales bacterium]